MKLFNDQEIISKTFDEADTGIKDPVDDTPDVKETEQADREINNIAATEFKEKLKDYGRSLYDLLHEQNITDIKEIIKQDLEKDTDEIAEFIKHILNY